VGCDLSATLVTKGDPVSDNKARKPDAEFHRAMDAAEATLATTGLLFERANEAAKRARELIIASRLARLERQGAFAAVGAQMRGDISLQAEASRNLRAVLVRHGVVAQARGVLASLGSPARASETEIPAGDDIWEFLRDWGHPGRS